MPSWTLAIDFGTSYTVAAARAEGRAPEIVEIAGERRMPSVVMVEPGGAIFVGRTAEDLSVSHPGSTLRALKNRLGDQIPAILDGRPYQVVTLVAALLREVYDQVIVQMGEPPAALHLTHPATWNQPRINRLIEAAAKAGLPRPLLVPEPVAAALSYAADVGLTPGKPIVVYDLGGGTFDSAVVTARDGGFSVIGRPGGDQHIGGELFDELLVNHIGATLDPAVWDAIQVGEDPLWRQVGAALRNEARKAKEALSAHTYTSVLIPLPAGLQQVRLSRDDFTGMVRPYIAATIVTLKRCVDEAGVRPDELAGISLVGGSSRSPIVEEMVREAFPMVPISRRGDPKATVAAGATLADRPSTMTPGLWRSQVTQEASPGTAPQQYRIAPPPLSNPPPPVSGPPGAGPPVAPVSSLPAAPISSLPAAPISSPPAAPISSPPSPPPPGPPPPGPPGPVSAPLASPAPVTPVQVGGLLQPEPARMSRRSRRALLLALSALVVAALVTVVVLVTRSDDTTSITSPDDSAQDSTTPDETIDTTAAETSVVSNPDDSTATSTDSSGSDTSSPDTAGPDTTSPDTSSPDTSSPDTSIPNEGLAIGTQLYVLAGHKGEVLSADFSNDDQYLVTGNVDGAAIVWSVDDGSEVAVLAGHAGEVYSVAFSPNGQTVATTGSDGTVRLWDAFSGDQLHVFTGHSGLVYQVRFSPDGGSLLSAGADHTVRLWDIASGAESANFTGSTEQVYFAAFSPNGEKVIAGGQDDIVREWSVFAADHPLLLEGHSADVKSGTFSPDGTLIAAAGDDGSTKVWDSTNGNLVYDLGFNEGGAVSTTFSHDGTRLMSCGYDDTAAIWDVATGILLGDLAGHTDTVFSATFSPDDSEVLTASEDGTAKIWDVSPGTPIGVVVATLKNGSPLPGAVFSHDGSLVATISTDGTAAIWTATD